jgi:hypothetical protein
MISLSKNTCGVCDSSDLVELLDLPGLPLTGIFVTEQPETVQKFDQGLAMCAECGHAQLKYAVDPEILYDSSYSHRTSVSHTSVAGNEFFAKYFTEVSSGRAVKNLIDVGCSDLGLLKNLRSVSERLHGIDPIWRNTEAPETPGINVIGDFVENVNILDEIGVAPDAVIAAHTLEHLNQPKATLQYLVDAASDDAIFMVEVPSYEAQVGRFRFDQIFHQHVNYFSIASVRRLISEVGGSYLTHTMNHGLLGGTILMAFTKAKYGGDDIPIADAPVPADVKSSYRRFISELETTAEHIESLSSMSIHGYGAAQLLPMLAYHMKTDFSVLESVLDDNPLHVGHTWPGLRVGIDVPDPRNNYSDSAFVITALDSARPIMRRCIEIGPREIISPLPVI